MHNLEHLLRERLAEGLKRRNLTSCSKWALEYRVMGQPYPGRWTFRYHPWLREPHDSIHTINVCQKAAQMGFTETMLNIAFYYLDVKGKDVLYLLPAKTPDATDFSASRFDPALELSPHLDKMFSDVKNVGHKRAGTRNLYIRGSRSRSGLKSVPVGLIILDEVDEMTQDNIPLALERTSGQREYLNWLLSTPTVDGEGINRYFRESTQDFFAFPCPSCSRFIEFRFPESLIITADNINDPNLSKSHYICYHCKTRLHHKSKPDYLGKGKWFPRYPQNQVKGWQIPQLYSSAKAGHPISIAKAYLKSHNNKSDEQEFHNSKLARTHAVEGSRITEGHLLDCMGNYLKSSSSISGKITTLGIDQGPKWIHCSIESFRLLPATYYDISENSHSTLLNELAVQNFEDLDRLMIDFKINFAVIDAQPERREATKFANRFYGRVRLCYYVEGVQGKQIHISDTGGEPSISVDRTTWLDTALGRFRSKSITVPKDISRDYKEHVKALTRIYTKDKNGNNVGRYVHGSNPDHFAHARTYAEIALHLSTTIGQNQPLKTKIF